jgi:type II secretory ATPase GspE/PulE/Tfp pilus assembly ATPase PilB-like protein
MNQQLALAIQRADPSEFERLAREQIGTYTIERNAHELVLTGETSISEAMAVTSGGAE